MIRAWVGWESNPRCDGLRIRCKACVCYQPQGPWSHPLESNQNLSGFSRARRPTTQEWDVTLRAPRRAAAASCRGCLARHPHRHRSSVVRDHRSLGPPCAGRTSGLAVLALMASTPVASRDRDYAVLISSRKVSSGVTFVRLRSPTARNVEGPPGVPGRPSAQTRHFHVTCVEDLQGYPYRIPANTPGLTDGS